MAIKKPLEIETAPAEEQDGAVEARYEAFARRLELTTKSGDVHKDFSHQSDAVQIDQEGVEEYRAREEAENIARAEKTKKVFEAEEEKLRIAMASAVVEQGFAPGFTFFYAAGKVVLALLGAYFMLSGLSRAYLLLAGHADKAPGTLDATLGLVAVATVALAVALLPARMAKIVGRIAYGATLIYFGISGAWGLIQLWRNPPAVGVRWWAGTLMLGSLVVLLWAFRSLFQLRARLYSSFSEPDQELLRNYPALANDRHLRIALYTVEGLIISCVYLAAAVIVFRTNLLELFLGCLARPALAFYVFYPFFAYLFVRKVFYGTTR